MRNYYWLITITIILMAMTVYANIQPPSGMSFQAQCSLKEELSTGGEKADFGKLTGPTSAELRELCDEMAKTHYGKLASGKIKDFRLVSLRDSDKCRNTRKLNTATLTSVKRMLVWWMERQISDCEEET